LTNKKQDIDTLTEEMRKGARVQEWQLTIAVLSLIIAIVTLVAENLYFVFDKSAISLIIGVLIVISIICIFASLHSVSTSSDSEKYSWYGRINAMETLRLSALTSEEPLKTTVLRLYISGLRTNYQYALLEGRKELGEYMKEQLVKYEKKLDEK